MVPRMSIKTEAQEDIGTAQNALNLVKYNLQRWQHILVLTKKSQCNLSEKKPYECDQCQRRFVYLSGLERHRKKFHDEGRDAAEPPEPPTFCAAVIQCKVCGEIFPDVDQYERHATHFDWGALLASVPAQFGDRWDIVFQMNLRLVVTCLAYKCEFCDALFSNTQSLFQHESKHDPADGFSCIFCEINLPTLESILAHRISKPKAFRTEYMGRIPNVHNVYSCNVCEHAFETLTQLYEHRRTESHYFPRLSFPTHGTEINRPRLMVNCETCGYLSAQAAQFTAHCNENHPKSVTGVVSVYRNAADNGDPCNRPSGDENPNGLSRPYLCERCGKTYTQSSHLWQHLRFHNGIRPFRCLTESCGRSFTIRPDLNDHIRKCHTGERPYKCEICDKRFLTGSVYYQHRLIHRGERRYACTDCDKRFYRADALKNHMRIHTGERPYDCHACERKFRQRGDREKHVRVKHPKPQ